MTLSCNIDREVPDALVGDPVRLGQIVTNLVGNAIKFTESGEVTVGVIVDYQAPGDVDLHFSVADTGIGIPNEKRELILDSFSQADPSTTRKFGGTGLGLAITSRLVGMMGGRIWVESVVGAGSTFHITARLDRGKTSETCAGRDRPDEQKRWSATGRDAASLSLDDAPLPLTILLAEDNPINREVVLRLLQKLGHVVVSVDNGAKAVDAIQTGGFDLVLMDVQMPVLDGFEATKAVREMEKNEDVRIPIIALTASAMKGDRERCLAAGMDGYLSKPILVDEFIDLVGSFSPPPPQLPYAHTGEASVNRDEVLHFVGGDEALLRRMVEMFLENWPEVLAEMEDAIEIGDCDTIQRAAHKLRGSVGYFRSQGVSDAARSLEEIANAGDITGIAEAYTALEIEINHLESEISPWVKELSS